MVKYELGNWNLTELVKNPKSPAFEKQIQLVEKKAKKFEKIKSNLNPNMPSKKFLNLLNNLEVISEKMSVIGGFLAIIAINCSTLKFLLRLDTNC